MMKMLLVKSGLFALIVLTILFLLESYSRKYVDTADYYKLTYDELFTPKVNADIVVIGASHGTHGINPGLLQYGTHKVFNFCLNGANPVFTLKWYKKLFSKYYKRPKLIIYEVDWFMFDSDWMNRKFEQDSKYFTYKEFITQAADLDNNTGTLVRNRHRILKLGNKYQLFIKNESKVKFDKYYRGYVPQVDVKGPLIEKTAKNFDEQIKAFGEMLDKLASDGIPVILVQTPEHIPGRNSPLIEENNKLLRRIAVRRGIPFLNYNDENKSFINYSEELFYDWGHLNEMGSNLFSAVLSADLKSFMPK